MANTLIKEVLRVNIYTEVPPNQIAAEKSYFISAIFKLLPYKQDGYEYLAPMRTHTHHIHAHTAHSSSHHRHTSHTYTHITHFSSHHRYTHTQS